MQTIISLTSTADRLTVARYTLLSLVDQRVAPDRIVLNLSRTPYLLDDGVESVPAWLREFSEQGLVEVRWTENTGPYRKLLPTLQGCEDIDVVVTCDDDVIYGQGWLAALLEHAARHPEAIICGHGRIPIRNLAGRLQSYVHWPRVWCDGDYPTLIPIGVAGVVYRKPLLDYEFLTWREFLHVAPKQDDLWFNMARERKGTTVRIAPGTRNHVYPIETGRALSDTNVLTKLEAGNSGLIRTMLQRAVYRLKAYAGVTVCENDVAWQRVEKASRAFDQRAATTMQGEGTGDI